MDDMKSRMEALLKGCAITAYDGTRLYTPDGRGFYPALWTRDFSYMVEGAGELIPAEDIRKCVDYLLSHAAEDGWIPDRVYADGSVRYAAGGEGFPGLNNLDNGPFLVLIADEYLKMCSPEDAKAQFEKWQKGLCAGVDCLETDARGLVYNDSERAHSPYGFTDCIKKTGSLCMESLLLWRALKALACWQRTCGMNGEGCESRAKRIEQNLWDAFASGDGLLYASTQICRQRDVWASCYALSIDFPLNGEQKDILARRLLNGKAEFVQRGQIRHLPEGEFWQETFVPVPKGEYQNGAYWATASGWYAEAVARADENAAREVLDEVLSDFEENGIFECVRGEYRKLDTYVASAANVYRVFKKYRETR